MQRIPLILVGANRFIDSACLMLTILLAAHKPCPDVSKPNVCCARQAAVPRQTRDKKQSARTTIMNLVSPPPVNMQSMHTFERIVPSPSRVTVIIKRVRSGRVGFLVRFFRGYHTAWIDVDGIRHQTKYCKQWWAQQFSLRIEEWFAPANIGTGRVSGWILDTWYLQPASYIMLKNMSSQITDICVCQCY
jgi:hypothetical protein